MQKHVKDIFDCNISQQLFIVLFDIRKKKIHLVTINHLLQAHQYCASRCHSKAARNQRHIDPCCCMISNTSLFSFAVQTVFLLLNTHQILVQVSKKKKNALQDGKRGMFFLVVPFSYIKCSTKVLMTKIHTQRYQKSSPPE